MTGSLKGGFVAGTSVHTTNGVKPIQQVQAGDLLLAPTDASGGATHSRVLQARAIPNVEIYSLVYFPKEQFDLAQQSGRLMSSSPNTEIIAGPDSLFWATAGWAKGSDLQGDEPKQLQQINGALSLVDRWAVLHRTVTENVGWVQGSFGNDLGRLVDLRDGKIQTTFERSKRALNREIDWGEEENYLRQTVYYLEAAGARGFFVGQPGILVSLQTE